VARQWKSSMYMPNRENPIRCPSMTEIRLTGSHSMPVSSDTSFTATSDGEYPTSAQPVGYNQMPESARRTNRISPSSLPTTAPTATFGVT
jgi:hypothetical protein